jgi:hypothetical protein
MVVKEETEMEMEELLSEEEIPDYQKSRKIPIISITKLYLNLPNFVSHHERVEISRCFRII